MHAVSNHIGRALQGWRDDWTVCCILPTAVCSASLRRQYASMDMWLLLCAEQLKHTLSTRSAMSCLCLSKAFLGRPRSFSSRRLTAFKLRVLQANIKWRRGQAGAWQAHG
jgi:hypothetical protein